MPKNVVKTPADERKWARAKRVAGTKYHGKSKWKVVMSIFKKMKAAHGK